MNDNIKKIIKPFMIFVLAFILFYSIFSNMRIEVKLAIVISFVVMFISFKKIKETQDDPENIYYDSYLKTVTDTLAIATKEMRYLESVSRMKDEELIFHLGIIKGCEKYLRSINPPLKYKKEHEETLNDLYFFVEDNKLRLENNKAELLEDKKQELNEEK